MSIDIMFIFGHAGLTLGTAVILTGVFNKKAGRQESGACSPECNSPRANLNVWVSAACRSLMQWVDIRVLLIGSLLPDIIDKPIGEYLFRRTFANGQIYAHTLLFTLVLAVTGLLLYRSRHRTWLLTLAFGTFTHLILDGMWATPRTLFWPLYGLSFLKSSISFWSWVQLVIQHLTRDPWILVPEIVGLLIFAWFIWLVARSGEFWTFVKYGKLSG